MEHATPARFRWFRFSLSHLFVLTLGIALGFAPLKLWELNAQGEPRISAHVQAIEVSRAQLASLGLSPSQSNSAIPVTTLDNSLIKQLAELRKAGQARVLAEPVLMTVSGRSTAFNLGGEIPVMVTNPDGTVWVDRREFGTRVHLLPTLLRNGRIRVSFDSEISTAEKVAREDSSRLPGFRRNQTQTEFDLASGETVVVSANFYEKASGEEVGMVILATVERVTAR